MYKTYTLAFQSLIYGVYVVLIPFSAHILLKRGLRTRANVVLLNAIFAPFVISSAFWVVSLADQIERIRVYFVDRSLRDSKSHNTLSYSLLFNALVFINYIFGDGVVVWRAYTLCKEGYRKALVVPISFMVLTTLFVFGIIGTRAATYLTPASSGASLNHALNILQVATIVWSLITNFSATLIISHKAWRHRQTIRDGLRNARNRSTQAERILALLIESGIIYLLSSVVLLVFMLIRLPYGTLGDIYTPVNLQIAGIYPTLVIVLICLQQTMEETTFWHASEATAHSTLRINPVSQTQHEGRPSGDLEVHVDDSSSHRQDMELANVKPEAVWRGLQLGRSYSC